MRTVGVEEELLLVDPETGVPRAVAGAVLRIEQAAEATSPSGMIEAELQQQQIEVGTRPCRTLAEVDDQVRAWRSRAAELAEASGARLAALATSPLPVDLETTPKARYQRMVEHLGLTAVEQLTCGCHVHVEVESPEEGVAVLDRIREWLPPLLALSANSPFWQGADTGYASFRSQAWSRFPGAGPTPVFGSAAAYEEQVASLVGTGVLLDRHMVYFDARLSDSYPTVEVRVADVCLDPADTVVVAGLVRALVDTAARAWVGREPLPGPSTDLVRLGSWRAGRSGISGVLLDPVDHRPRPAVEVVGRLLDHVRPALRSNGDLDRVEAGVRRVFERGNGADWQRRVFAGSGDLARLVRAAAGRTAG